LDCDSPRSPVSPPASPTEGHVMNQLDEHQAAAAAAAAAGRVRALRINSLAAVVMLLIEYGLGLWLNLYAELPAGDRGASVPAGFGRAVADGPAGLTIHALLGVALLASSIAVVVRAARVAGPGIIALAALGLLATISA